MDFFKRQMALPGWGEEGQERLRKSHVFVAGAGGLGSPLLVYLARAGLGRLTFSDHDTVHETNLHRQFLYGKDTVGEPKSPLGRDVLERVHSLDPATEIRALDKQCTRDSLPGLVPEDASILVDCLDTFTARHDLNRFAVERDIPLVHGAVSGMRGQLTLVVPGETACLGCFLPAGDRGREEAVAGPAAGVIGSMQALQVLIWLTGTGTPLTNKLYFWDGNSGESSVLNLKMNPRCSICGKSGTG
jgi:adenylyltransferase/sulfurtransferase